MTHTEKVLAIKAAVHRREKAKKAEASRLKRASKWEPCAKAGLAENHCPSGYMTKAQAMDYMGMSKAALHKRETSGYLEPHKAGIYNYYRKEDLDRSEVLAMESRAKGHEKKRKHKA